MKFAHCKTHLTLLVVLVMCSRLIAQGVSVEDLEFRGNDRISDGQLREAIKTESNPWYDTILFWKDDKRFDEKVLLNDLLRIERFYQNEGFLDAIVTDYDLQFNQSGDEVEIVVHIEEGEPTMVAGIEFSPANGISLPFDHEELHKAVKLKEGKRFRDEDLRLDYDALVRKFGNSGYPYIKVKVKPHFDDQENTVVLQWLLQPGKYTQFGDIRITGNRSVSNRVIRRGLDFKEGDEFAQKELSEAQSQIYRLELFRYVNLQATDLGRQPEQVPIQIEVRERSLRTIETGVGYGSEEALRLKADWTHRNFLGGARILRAEARHSTNILPLNLELELSQPFFLDNQNDLIIKPFFTWQDEESFEARRYGVETTFNRQLTNRTNAFVTNRFSRDSVRVKDETAPGELDNVYNKSILLLGIRTNTTDQLFTPTEGHIASFVLEEAGLLFQSRFRYVKLLGEVRHYQDLAGSVLASRLLVGTMHPFGGSDVTPVEERFFAGGSYSVRGWERQELGPQTRNPETGRRTPIGGDSKIAGSLEVRASLYKRLGGAVFLDYGNVWEDWNGFDLLDLKYALGLGLRYGTPIGPFRVDFAWKLNKQFTEEDDFQIHVSIGQAF